jgi:hypothetical protein
LMSYLEDLLKLNQRMTTNDVAGDFLAGLSHIQSGVAARNLGEFHAQQYEQNAGQAQASAQRSAIEVDRQAQYVASAALASAAASGGGASDPTVVNLIARNAGEMAYRKQVALYEGDELARGLKVHADTARYSGKSAEANGLIAGIGSIYNANSTLMKGQARESSILQRFGGGGPAQTQPEEETPWWGKAPPRGAG